MAWCGIPQAIDLPSALRVEREMAEPGLTAILTSRRAALFEHDVGIRQFPANPIAPDLELSITQLSKKPPPRGGGRSKIGDSELEVMK